MGHQYVKESDTFSTSQNGTVPKPTAQEVSDNKYLRADGTWKNPPGGGGGSSVTITPTLSSGTKIADFEIDGDAGELYAPTGGSSGHTYDGNEKLIGTWFGDDLYEKTIYYQSPGGQADNDVIIDNTILHGTNCLVVDISGVQTYGYLDGSHPGAYSDPEPLSQATLYLPFYGGATAQSGQIYLYSDGIHFMKKMAASNANGIILTVRYIKITD